MFKKWQTQKVEFKCEIFFFSIGEIAGERHFAIESFKIVGSVLKIWRSFKKLHYSAQLGEISTFVQKVANSKSWVQMWNFFLQHGEIAGERHFAIESFKIFGSVLKIWRSLKKFTLSAQLGEISTFVQKVANSKSWVQMWNFFLQHRWDSRRETLCHWKF